MKQTLPFSQVTLEELRTNLAELAGQVMYGKERISVTKYNRQAFVILSPEDYQALLDPTLRLSKKEWSDNITALNAIRNQLPESDPKDAEKSVVSEIKAVRAEKQ